MAKARFYQVNGWRPPMKPGQQYGTHVTFGVVCAGAKQAVDHVSSEHPEVRIDNVNERGQIDAVLPA